MAADWFCGILSSTSLGKASKAQEVCKGIYRRARRVYKGKGGTGKALAVSMVDNSSQPGPGLYQDDGGDVLQEQDDFGAKVLGAINASQHIAVGDKTWHWLPRTRTDRLCRRRKRNSGAHTGPQSVREETAESDAHCWAEPNPTHSQDLTPQDAN